MLKISAKASATLSLILTCFILALLLVLTCTLPAIVGWYLAVTARPQLDGTAITVLLYAALVPGFVAVVALLRLLQSVRRDEVFTDGAVGNLRLLSYCCFAEAVLFLALAWFFEFSVCVAFGALFMGVILRVVKNVIERAVALKTENDFTI